MWLSFAGWLAPKRTSTKVEGHSFLLDAFTARELAGIVRLCCTGCSLLDSVLGLGQVALQSRFALGGRLPSANWLVLL